MYEHEEVEEKEGKEFAKEINAIFQKTSAKDSSGIEDLFAKIGKKFLDPLAPQGAGATKNNLKEDKNTIRLENNDEGVIRKKGCC